MVTLIASRVRSTDRSLKFLQTQATHFETVMTTVDKVSNKNKVTHSPTSLGQSLWTQVWNTWHTPGIPSGATTVHYFCKYSSNFLNKGKESGSKIISPCLWSVKFRSSVWPSALSLTLRRSCILFNMVFKRASLALLSSLKFSMTLVLHWTAD